MDSTTWTELGWSSRTAHWLAGIEGSTPMRKGHTETIATAHDRLGPASDVQAAAAAIHARAHLGKLGIVARTSTDALCAAAIMRLADDTHTELIEVDASPQRALKRLHQAGIRTAVLCGAGAQDRAALEHHTRTGLVCIAIDASADTPSKPREAALVLAPRTSHASHKWHGASDAVVAWTLAETMAAIRSTTRDAHTRASLAGLAVIANMRARPPWTPLGGLAHALARSAARSRRLSAMAQALGAGTSREPDAWQRTLATRLDAICATEGARALHDVLNAHTETTLEHACSALHRHARTAHETLATILHDAHHRVVITNASPPIGAALRAAAAEALSRRTATPIAVLATNDTDERLVGALATPDWLCPALMTAGIALHTRRWNTITATPAAVRALNTAMQAHARHVPTPFALSGEGLDQGQLEELLDDLEALAPYGRGWARPRVRVDPAIVVRTTLREEKGSCHIRALIRAGGPCATLNAAYADAHTRRTLQPDQAGIPAKKRVGIVAALVRTPSARAGLTLERLLVPDTPQFTSQGNVAPRGRRTM